MDYSKTFNDAFLAPNNTAITTPDSHVNDVIRTYYDVDEPFVYTKTLLWDMEVKKAHHPDKYIRHVARQGSLRTFDHRTEGHLEYFVRVTDQRTWKDPSEYETVIELVCLDHQEQKATFLGVSEIKDPEGNTIVASGKQPLFFVEHAASGSEEEPVNTWRIVHLTEERDRSMEEAFESFSHSPFLRLFNEVFIREDMGKVLVRKTSTE